MFLKCVAQNATMFMVQMVVMYGCAYARIGIAKAVKAKTLNFNGIKTMQ